ncbi:SCO family protein [Psychromonas sp. PT13]|uniref:SCO family protein n=1 Tax=Psychromonas sp. PT13 TaxID=3439547 RepID=UPI003EB71984
MNKNPTKLILSIGVLALLGIFALYMSTTDSPIGEKVQQFKDLGGRFQLDSANGRIDLQEYNGKVVVLYFGFLNCADVCPSSMGVMSGAFKKLPSDIYPQVQGFFISVDPTRDDLTSLNDFAQYFDHRIMGLTGTEKEIEILSKQYGVYFDMVDLESSQLGYTVDHSSQFYIISRTGELVDVMNHNTTPIELAARIKREIDKQQKDPQ